MFADYEGELPDFNTKIEGKTPVLITRNLVMFPGILMPVLIGRKTTLNLIKYVEKHPDTVFAVISQKDGNVDEPKEKDLHRMGIYAKLVRVFDIPGSPNGENRTARLLRKNIFRVVTIFLMIRNSHSTISHIQLSLSIIFVPTCLSVCRKRYNC